MAIYGVCIPFAHSTRPSGTIFVAAFTVFLDELTSPQWALDTTVHTVEHYLPKQLVTGKKKSKENDKETHQMKDSQPPHPQSIDNNSMMSVDLTAGLVGFGAGRRKLCRSQRPSQLGKTCLGELGSTSHNPCNNQSSPSYSSCSGLSALPRHTIRPSVITSHRLSFIVAYHASA